MPANYPVPQPSEIDDEFPLRIADPSLSVPLPFTFVVHSTPEMDPFFKVLLLSATFLAAPLLILIIAMCVNFCHNRSTTNQTSSSSRRQSEIIRPPDLEFDFDVDGVYREDPFEDMEIETMSAIDGVFSPTKSLEVDPTQENDETVLILKKEDVKREERPSSKTKPTSTTKKHKHGGTGGTHPSTTRSRDTPKSQVEKTQTMGPVGEREGSAKSQVHAPKDPVKDGDTQLTHTRSKGPRPRDGKLELQSTQSLSDHFTQKSHNTNNPEKSTSRD